MTGSKTSKYQISDNLRFIRRISGLNQEETSRLMGISRSSYNALEVGARDATLQDISTLESISGISMDVWLIVNMRTSFRDEFESGASLLGITEFIHEYCRLSHKGRRIIARHISEYYCREAEI